MKGGPGAVASDRATAAVLAGVVAAAALAGGWRWTVRTPAPAAASRAATPGETAPAGLTGGVPGAMVHLGVAVSGIGGNRRAGQCTPQVQRMSAAADEGRLGIEVRYDSAEPTLVVVEVAPG